MAAGQKRQFRVPMSAANSRPSCKYFEDLELTFAKAEPRHAGKATGIACSLKKAPARQIEFAGSGIELGDVVFSGGLRDGLEDASDSLLVTEIYAQRLQELTEGEAELEGTVAAWGLKLAGNARAASLEEIFEDLIEEIGTANCRRWRAAHEDPDVITHRKLFGLDFIRRCHGGFQAWRLNPWMWVIGFEWYPIRPADLLSRIASGTLERRRA